MGICGYFSKGKLFLFFILIAAIVTLIKTMNLINIRDIVIYKVSALMSFEQKLLTSDNYIKLHDKYKSLNSQMPDGDFIVFLGDSHILGLDNYRNDISTSIINRGIKGDTTVGVLSRIENNLNNIKANKLFLLVGYNDLRYRNNAEIVNNLGKIIHSSHAKTIYVFSLLPVHRSRVWINQRIVEINKLLHEICIKNNATYIDAYSNMLSGNNEISDDLTKDGTHLQEKYYKKLALLINKYL